MPSANADGGGQSPLLLKLTEVPLLLRDVPLSTYVSVGSARESIYLVRERDLEEVVGAIRKRGPRRLCG